MKLWNNTVRFFKKDFFFVTKFNIGKDIVPTIIFGFCFSVILNFIKNYVAFHNIPQSVKTINLKISFGWYLISFFMGFVFNTVIYKNYFTTRKILKSEYGIGKAFFLLLKNLLKDLDSVKESSRDWKLKETSYFLKVNNARTGNMLQFDPDNDSVNLLHKVEGMISVTQADPSEWLNPTYNFFLVNNYVASIAKAVLANSPITAIKFCSNRTDSQFQEFNKKKIEVLKELSQLRIDGSLANYLKEKRIFVRFYILSEEEASNNQSIIETLIAGHDLFGCYLFFIKKEFYDNLFKAKPEYKIFNAFLQNIKYKLEDNSGKVDLAIAQSNNELTAIYRSGNKLTPEPLNIDNIKLFETFLKKLSSYLYHDCDNKDHLLDQYFEDKGFIKNKAYCYLYFEKHVCNEGPK